MKLLLDQDVYAITARFLENEGHDVIRASQIGMTHASDEKLLSTAQQQERIFVTRDRDFGNLVFVKGLGAGVIYLRMVPSTLDAMHRELKNALSAYPEPDLKQAFVVVGPDEHQIRRIPAI